MADQTAFLAELRKRGAADIHRVVFRHNRTRLLSISRDRVTLNVHACFLSAPPEVLDAVARFVTADPRSAAHRRAVAALRAWPGVEEGLRAARAARPARAAEPAAECSASPEQRRFLCELYARLNRERFGGRLPEDVPIRVSRRMARRLGQVRFDSGTSRRRLRYEQADLFGGSGKNSPPGSPGRRVLEIALSADLFIEGNDRELLDTLLHEMAHVEAYLVHGHRGHGGIWRTVARRVGCEPRACSRRPVRRRRRGGAVPDRIPRLAEA